MQFGENVTVDDVLRYLDRLDGTVDVEKCRDAVDGSIYSKMCGTQGVMVIWKGGSAVNAYTPPGWEQIGLWNIEFEKGLDDEGQMAVVKENIDRHMDERNYPF